MFSRYIRVVYDSFFSLVGRHADKDDPCCPVAALLGLVIFGIAEFADPFHLPNRAGLRDGRSKTSQSRSGLRLKHKCKGIFGRN